MSVGRSLLWSAILLAACSADGGGDDAGDPADLDCPQIFHQGTFPEYRVTISASEWAALEDEFLHRAEREAMGLDPKPYHPIEFEYDGTGYPGVELRLKGESSWWETIAFDEHPKMQFVIAFNREDSSGRFFGVRKLDLDMPRTDASFLRQRLALYYLRTAGLAAQCANSARLVINGAYYGLFTNMERLDKEFLQRVFPGASDGDLWKGGRTIETNEDTFTWDRLDAFWHVAGIDELAGLADLDVSTREWAAEAMMPDGDGYYMGRPNFFLYDHPTRGFTWIAHDLDAAYDFLPADISPMFPDVVGGNAHDREHFALVMADEGWRTVYLDHLAEARSDYDAAALTDRVDEWSAQIADAAAADPMRPFDDYTHDLAVSGLRDYPPARAQTIDGWLDCRAGGGADADGDGYDYCYDCDDGNRDVHPGAVEVCNGVDDDCDSTTDEGFALEGDSCE